MTIYIFTDAWHPQVNGVVRTLETTRDVLVHEMNQNVAIVAPEGFLAPLLFYPSIKVEPLPEKRLKTIFAGIRKEDFVHIATEGPIGRAARKLCIKDQRPFTTSYHTRYPEYLYDYLPPGLNQVTKKLAYMYLRNFHNAACAVMVTTPSMQVALEARRFRNTRVWSRGVNLDLFKPYGKELTLYEKFPRPILLYVGRVATEKNIETFLQTPTPGTKVVVGEGPAKTTLQQAYPSAHFLGEKKGEELARCFAAADLFVFPSKTDTFGLVMLEAMACGLRVAAYPVPGPIDILSRPEARGFSILDENLGTAINKALALPDRPETPRAYVAEYYSWLASTRNFHNYLQEQPTPKAKRRMKLIPIIGKRMTFLSRLGRSGFDF